MGGYLGSTPLVLPLGGGWYMWSSSKDLTGADISSSGNTLAMGSADNSATGVIRNGTNIRDVYNIRYTRV